jgi:hypothetical protein
MNANPKVTIRLNHLQAFITQRDSKRLTQFHVLRRMKLSPSFFNHAVCLNSHAGDVATMGLKSFTWNVCKGNAVNNVLLWLHLEG